MTPSGLSVQNELRRFLARVHRTWTLHVAGRWLATGAGVLVGLFWLLVPLEQVNGLPVAVRVGLWALVAVALLVGSLLALRLWRDRAFQRRQAVGLEHYAPALREQLITAVDTDSPESRRLGYADWLLDHTVRQAHARASALNLRGYYKHAGLWRSLRYFGLALAATLLLGALFPRPAGRTLQALANPTTDLPRPVPFVWQVEAERSILQYESVELKASVSGSRLPALALLHWRYGDFGEPFTEELTPTDGSRFVHTMSSVPRSIQYWFEADGQKSATSQIHVTSRPELLALTGECLPPSYTGAKPFELSASSRRWVVPEGSQIELTAESDRPLASGYVLFADSSQAVVEVDGTTGTARFHSTGKRTLRVFVTDTAGFSNYDPVPVQLETIPDLPPQIALLEPAGDGDIPEAMAVRVAVALLDDYGLSRLEMRYLVEGEAGSGEAHTREMALPSGFGREGVYQFNWSLSDLRLFPGDRVLYAARVYDNRRPSAQWAETPVQVLRLPSLDEIIAETERNQSERTDEVAEAVKRQQDLSQKLREMAMEMTGQDQVQWEDRRQLEEAQAAQENLAKNLEEWADELEKEAEALAENRMASLEMLQKMNEISRLLEEVMTPELREAMEKLKQAMEAMTPEEMRQALEQFQMNQEELLQQLDRTLAQLRRMQIEQMMENMLRQAERLAQNQEEQNRGLEQSADQRALDSLARQEQALTEELKALQEKAAKLSELNSQNQPNPNVQEFADAASETDAGADMSEMTQEMQQGQKGNAGSSGKKAASKLRKMLSQMQQEMQEMQNQMSAEQLAALRDLTRRTLELSEEQEVLGDSVGALSHGSLALRELAAQQAAMKQSISRLAEDFNREAKENLFLSPEVRKQLSESSRSCQSAVGTLAERNGVAAQNFQYETMVSLNEASKSLMESMQNQSQCQGQNAGQGEMHAGMQSLAQNQLSLNQSSQAMSNPYGLSPTEQEAVKRLAGQQGSIQQSMRDLAGQYTQSRDRLGRLEEMAKSMDEVIEGLESGELSDETLERQRNIYNRMLDFQKSLQRQDFENRRQSESGQTIAGHRPDTDPSEMMRRPDAPDWNRFQGEWYPPAFRALVKEYFETVSRKAGPSE